MTAPPISEQPDTGTGEDQLGGLIVGDVGFADALTNAGAPQELIDLLVFITTTFQSVSFSEADILGWIDEANNAGVDGNRTLDQLRSDILSFRVGEDTIKAWYAQQTGEAVENIDDATIGGLLDGTITFSSVIADSEQPKVVFEVGGGDLADTPGPVGGAGTVIPSGASLVKVTNPLGSDADALYFLQYNVFGVSIAYEVGDEGELEALFPGGVADFDSLVTFDGAQFDESSIITVGPLDEIIGADESLQSIFERDLAALGLEGVPDWILEDDTASALMVLSIQEGWSAARTANELAGTAAFQERYGAFDAVATFLGTDDPLAVTEVYQQWEGQLRASLLAIRGPQTDVSDEYLTELISTGWSPEQIIPVLTAEMDLFDNPDHLDQTNAILESFGLAPVDEDGFIDILTGTAPSDIYQAINAALQLQSLTDAGVDIDAEFVAALGGVPDEGVVSGDAFSDAAKETALLIARNFGALQTEQFGLTQEDLVSVIFGQNNPETGKTAAEIEQSLQSIQRTFAAQASGFSGATSFLNEAGELQIAGFQNL
ncbi:MAG: hypothetical protein DWQ40_00420 [Actinobacteria bacterium]|nr:MAG: hypothetical protein DWQ40_00420 [Actinomycetota bacterium]REK35566.1 MAG: hypothetical protein DWQ20_05965 [Actinomycetota bacterium]